MHEWVLAIDFGTSFTVAASRIGTEPPEILEIAGARRTPSVVFVADDGVISVGTTAVELATAQPDRAVTAAKLRLGDPHPVDVGGQAVPATSMVAAVLAHVYERAVRHHGSAPAETRLTHPAAWGPARRGQLLKAAALAGLPQPRLVPEAIAAAITHTENAPVPPGRHVLVYDFGGGTLDLALLRTTADGFEFVGRPGGDPELGGEAIDDVLTAELASRLPADARRQLETADDAAWRQAAAALAREARRAKELLSAQPRAEVLIPLPSGTLTTSLDRRDLDELVQPSFTKSARLAAHLVTRNGLEPDDLAAVFLTGGSTRSPGVVAALEEALPGVAISRRVDPRTAIVLGATHPRAVAVGTAAAVDADPTPPTAWDLGITLGPSSDPDADRPPVPALRTPSLVVIAGPATGRRFTLADRMVLGRAPTAAICLTDPALSRQHAIISCVGDAVFIEDAGSRNGTAVDGEPVSGPRLLAADDLVEVGASLLRFEVDSAPVPDADPTTPFVVERVLVTPVPAPPKLAGRPDAARAADIYRTEVSTIAAELRDAARHEGSRRERRSPGIADVLGRVERGETARVARPHLHPEFLAVRVGCGETSLLPRVEIGTGGDPGLRSWAASVVAAAATVPAAPMVVSIEAVPVVVLTGDAALARAGARWLLAQIVALHRPQDVGVRLLVDGPDWDWLAGVPHVLGPHDEADPGAFVVTVADQWPLTHADPHDQVPALSTVLLVSPSVPATLPAGTVTLAYEPRPARVVISGPIDTPTGAGPVMADVLSLELARTLGATLAHEIRPAASTSEDHRPRS